MKNHSLAVVADLCPVSGKLRQHVNDNHSSCVQDHDGKLATPVDCVRG